MKTFSIIFLVLIIGIAIFLGVFLTRDNRTGENPGSETPNSETPTASLASLEWRFEGFVDAENVSRTRIFIDAMYDNGKMLSRAVDEVMGSCNQIDATRDDMDMVRGSIKIQCYAAGLGHWFKVVQGADSYNVQRKTFEEALPNYEPPVYVYETVAELPLKN